MKKLRTVIVDDEPLAIDLLKDYCSRLQELDVVESFTEPSDAFLFLSSGKADLVLLDINMPGLSGIELAKVIPSDIAVIFTTAYRDYGPEAYEINAVDYLLKPIAWPRFLQAVSKVLETPEEAESFIMIRSDRKDYRIKLSDIVYIEGVKDYVKVVTVDKTLLTKSGLGSFLDNQLNSNFIRIHKSYAVNRDHVEAMGQHALLVKGQELPLGDTYRSEIHKIWKAG